MPEAKPAGTGADRPMRILVVDDLEVNRDLLMRRVTRLGHRAGPAVNGRDALAQLRQQDWDLVLLDITMPEMDGYQTLREIRADPALTQLPVVMVSAIDETDSVVRCLELGADDYLPKPFNPLVLQARVASSLAKKRLQDQQSALLDALSRELEIGRRIQQGFLPAQLPSLVGWTLGASCVPARQVGGDFYDAFVLPDGTVAMLVADVCDKGVGAALYMALFRTLLRAMASQTVPAETPAELLVRSVGFTNDYIAGVHGHENMFATLFFALLDPHTGCLHYLNAGHEAGLLWQPDGGVQTLGVTGPAVGLLAGQRCRVQTHALQAGAHLFLYTDGATEAGGASGAFGEDALARLVAAPAGTAQQLVDQVGAALSLHGQGSEPHDDVTLFCLASAEPV
jgi:sigma-B regulation protein RsbU (phosphoserine phosphatase)